MINAAKILAILVGAASLSSTRCMAAEIVLHCSYDEFVTGTNGAQEHRNADQIIRVGEGVYRIWSDIDANWGGNQCQPETCHFKDNLFSYASDNRVEEGGFVLRYIRNVLYDVSSGHYSANLKNSTAALVTQYEVETTVYDDGQCRPIADPAISKSN